jgi:hypothetical protein
VEAPSGCRPAGIVRATANNRRMPDLSALLLRRSVGSLRSESTRCSGCRRSPLAGERLHEMDTGRVLCDLCLVRLPETDRNTVRVERVHASEHTLAVAPRAL